MKHSYSIILFSFVVLMSFPTKLKAQCVKIDSLEAILPTSQSRQKVDIWNELSKLYAQAENTGVALEYARQAVGFSQRLGYEKGLGWALINKANVIYMNNPQNSNLLEAIRSFNQAQAIFTKLKDKSASAATYHHFGKFYFNIAYAQTIFRDSAAKYYEKAYKLYQELSDDVNSSDMANDLALVYFEKGDKSKAMEYAQKTIQKNETSFNPTKLVAESAEGELNAQRDFSILVIALLIVMALAALIVVRAFILTRKTNKLLEIQKADLAQKNKEIESKNEEIEKRNVEIQEAIKTVELRNKEITRNNKEILLQQTEIELRNAELAEKNDGLKLQQEEIKTQRDNLEKQAHELAEQAHELKRSYDTITILSRIGQSITSTLNFKEIFDSFFGYVIQMMPADGFRVSQYHPETGELEYKFNIENQSKKPLIKVSMREDYNPAVYCVKQRRALIVNAKQDLKLYDLDEYSIKPIFNSMLYCPLIHEDKAIGAVGVYCKAENAYDQHDLDTLKTLAAYVTIAFKNAETYEILNAAQTQLVEAEKMAALGNLVAGVAHEINTPVGICVTASSRMLSKTEEFMKIYENNQMKRKDLGDFLDIVQEGGKILMTNLRRAADLVQGFKRVAVEQSSENKRVFNLKTYLQETVMALQPELKNKPYQIDLDLGEIEINNYPGAFSQIITNLVMNSLIHGFKGLDHGVIKIKTFTRNKYLIMTYSDDGNGMTPEILNKIYEPFFTTNREGGGSGLGMNIVYNLAVQKLGGKLNAESSPNKGVTFTFEIPLNI
jgi:signal transduction histidine kinase